MNPLVFTGALGLAGIGLWLYMREAEAKSVESTTLLDAPGSGEKDIETQIMTAAEDVFLGAWHTELISGRGEAYKELFESAERLHGLPRFMLARQAWQESRYKANAVNAGSGAQGILQIVPKWHPGVDPFDPVEAIPYAAKYDRQLRDRFGSWRLALAAYNWGPTNVSNWLKAGGNPAKLPSETRDYQNEILADIAELNPGVNLG